LIHRGRRVPRGKRYNPLVDEESIRLHEQRASAPPRSVSNATSISASLLAWTISIFSPSFLRGKRIPYTPLGELIVWVDEKADQRRGGD
jgi:hypothetical protein